jgi:hypothetical protein
MDLPQTDAGVPAAGIDPSLEELAAIITIADIFDWLGTAEPTRAAFIAAMGGGQLKLRDLVFVKQAEWDRAIATIRVPVDNEQPRNLSAVETGHIAMVRRVSRLRVGLKAVEDPAIQPGQAAGGLPPSGTSLFGALAPATAPAQAAEPTIKLSVILDPSMDTALQRLPQARIRALFNEYAKSRGAEPAEDVEPTVEQVSAIAQVVAADLVPYADFSLLGPHGKRMVGKLSYLAWTFQPDGTWHRKELPGPPSFEHWWASFRVLRTIYLLLDIAPPELLDNYGEMLRGFHQLYGPDTWFIIYTADVRMRSEQFDRLRRFAERDHEIALACGQPSSFDPAKQWYATFRAAIADKLWWDENLHRPAMLYLTKCKSAAESVTDGTVQNFDASTPHRRDAGQHRSRSRGRTRNQKRAARRAGGGSASQGDGGTSAGKGFCNAYNSPNGCHRTDCPYKCGYCSYCKKRGHSEVVCRANPLNNTLASGPSAPPPSQGGAGSGGAGKGGGKKGKGKRW